MVTGSTVSQPPLAAPALARRQFLESRVFIVRAIMARVDRRGVAGGETEECSALDTSHSRRENLTVIQFLGVAVGITLGFARHPADFSPGYSRPDFPFVEQLVIRPKKEPRSPEDVWQLRGDANTKGGCVPAGGTCGNLWEGRSCCQANPGKSGQGNQHGRGLIHGGTAAPRHHCSRRHRAVRSRATAKGTKIQALYALDGQGFPLSPGGPQGEIGRAIERTRRMVFPSQGSTPRVVPASKGCKRIGHAHLF